VTGSWGLEWLGMVAVALEPFPLCVAMVRLESICQAWTSWTFSGIVVLLRNEEEVCGVEYQVRSLMVDGGMEGRGWVLGMEDAEKLSFRGGCGLVLREAALREVRVDCGKRQIFATLPD
jgi:hypothetical protein